MRSKNGPVSIRPATQEEMRRLKKRTLNRGSVKAKRMPGDYGLVFGRPSKKPLFIGGEGGRNWSVPSTKC